MVREEEQSNTIYESRGEKIVSLKGGKSTVRLGRFLKPCVKSVSKSVAIPNTPLLSEIFSHKLQKWPSEVVFKGWKLPQKKWEEWVEQLAPKYAAIWERTGICDAIMCSISEIRCNRDLVIGLSEFWCPNTNTFVFPWGEATITLEDVMILGGFPVLGEPVTSPLTGELVKIEEEMKKKRMEMSREKSKKATHSGWMKHYMENQSEFEHAAFLSLWLSRYVFPPLAEETIGKHVFPIAIHLSRGKPMALAPAVLASLYRNLRLLTKQAMDSSKPISVSGTLQLVQLWACERFPLLAPSSPNLLKPGEPRISRWHKLSSRINLPLVRLALRLVDNFQWRPYAANLKNWRHLSFYKETEQLLLDCPSLDEELRSFVKCLRASELVGIDCKEKYMPHRVAMQFGLDQDLPGDIYDLNITLENVRFFVPSRSFEPGVSARYFNWWKEAKLARKGAMKDILLRERFLKNPIESPSVRPGKNKDDDCASVGSWRVKKCMKPEQVSTKSERGKCLASVYSKDTKRMLKCSSDDPPVSSVLLTSFRKGATLKSNISLVQAEKNEDDCNTSVASRSLKDPHKFSQVLNHSNSHEESHASVTAKFPSKIKKQIIQDSSDDDNIPFSERLKRHAGSTNRASPHKYFPSPSKIKKQIFQDSSDDDNIVFSERLKRLAGSANRASLHKAYPSPSKIKKQIFRHSRDDDHILFSEHLKCRAGSANRASHHKAYPCYQSQNVVSPTLGVGIENKRMRKFSTTTEGSKGVVRQVNGFAAESKRKATDSTNAPNGFTKEVKRKAGDSVEEPLKIAKVSKEIEKGKASKGSVEGAAKERGRKRGGESLNNPIEVDYYIKSTRSETQELGLEGRVWKLEKQLEELLG